MDNRTQIPAMTNIKALLASSKDPNSMGFALRNKRFRIFENLVNENFAENHTVRILDLGGAAYFWEDKDIFLRGRLEITLLNLQKEDNLPPGITSMAGNATDLSAFSDDSFDIVFSNSVIEHVYTWENQKKMASECMRVGRKFFVQTPYKHFFMEAHYVLPFIQYLPKSLSFWILTKTKLSRMQRWDPSEARQYLDEIRLLNKKEMRQLFPKAAIYREKLWGMTKSLTAHNMDAGVSRV